MFLTLHDLARGGLGRAARAAVASRVSGSASAQCHKTARTLTFVLRHDRLAPVSAAGEVFSTLV